MQVKHVAVIGSFSPDILLEKNKTIRRAGGAVTYTGLSLAKLNYHTSLLFCLAKTDLSSCEALLNSCHCLIGESPKSSCFENSTKEDGRREQRLVSIARPIRVSQMEEVRSLRDGQKLDWIHYSPLHPLDIAPEVFVAGRALAENCSLDMQGFLREVSPNGKVTPALGGHWRSALSAVDWVKFADEEWNRFTSTTKISRQELIAEFNLKGVIVTKGSKGGQLTERLNIEQLNSVNYAAIHAEDLAGSTGAGDVFMAGFIHGKLEGRSASEAVDQGALLAARQVAGKWLTEELLQIA